MVESVASRFLDQASLGSLWPSFAANTKPISAGAQETNGFNRENANAWWINTHREEPRYRWDISRADWAHFDREEAEEVEGCKSDGSQGVRRKRGERSGPSWKEGKEGL